MRVAVLCQEEPVFLGPFLIRTIEMHPEKVVSVFIAGKRGAGEKKGTIGRKIEALRIFWNIMEPRGFFQGLGLRLRVKLLGLRDPRSVEGQARRLGIAIRRVDNPNSDTFKEELRNLAPDVVLNQSELILKEEILSIPRLGFVNRHASLLPEFRGRMAAFWSHAAEPPAYGVTIHMVDQGIDTGRIILQKKFPGISPSWAYPRVMTVLCREAPGLFWQAMEMLTKEDFKPEEQIPEGKPNRFPTLEESRQYQRILLSRRQREVAHVSAP